MTGQEVKVYRVADDSYLVDTGYAVTEIEIDGVRLKDFRTGTIEKCPESINKISNEGVTIEYKSQFDGTVISVDEYNSRSESVRSKGNLTYDDEMYFESIDDEYAYKKFFREWKGVVEYREKIISCPIIHIDVRSKSDNKYIKPYRLINGTMKDPLYVMNINAMEIARELADKYGYKYLEHDSDAPKREWSVPNHSRDTLKFMKVGGKYAQLGNIVGISVGAVGTYDELTLKFNQEYAKVEQWFKNSEDKLFPKGVDRLSATRLIELIESAKMSLVRIRTYKSDEASKSSALRNINEAIQMLKSSLESK